MKILTPENIEVGRRKILSNASQLIEEAELLLKAEHNARAYTLAHLASEELAKIPMLVRAGFDSLCGTEVNWDKLERKLISHHKKLEGILAVDFLHGPEIEEMADIKRFEEDLKRIPDYNTMKNWSIYVSYIGGEFREPAEIIIKPLAAEMVKLAKNRFSFFTKMEKISGGSLERMQKDPRFLSEVESFIKTPGKIFANEIHDSTQQ